MTYDLRDRRPALFTVLLVLMSIHQMNEVGIWLDTGVASASTGFGEYPETGVNVLAGVAVFYVLRLVRDERQLADDLESTLGRLRELERQNDRLEEFASVVSHDLRSPLNTAKGYTRMARAEGDTDPLDRVERALNRMDDIVDDSLTLARRTHTVEDPQPVAVDDLVTDCWLVVDSETATLRSESFTVTGDPDRLRHLFENLFRNAIQHSDDPVTVEVGPLDEGGFYVEDDGPGIPQEDQSTVLNLGYTTDDDGTGFGLAIVDRVADAHGWSVDVTDGADGGTRFEFRPADDREPEDSPLATSLDGDADPSDLSA